MIIILKNLADYRLKSSENEFHLRIRAHLIREPDSFWTSFILQYQMK